MAAHRLGRIGLPPSDADAVRRPCFSGLRPQMSYVTQLNRPLQKQIQMAPAAVNTMGAADSGKAWADRATGGGGVKPQSSWGPGTLPSALRRPGRQMTKGLHPPDLGRLA